jgi:predicted HD phosphohydrolase
MAESATFTDMRDSTAEDWSIIARRAVEFAQHLPDRALDHLRMLKGDSGGFAVDRLEHCLQTATRAYRDGRDEEYVVCALLHDIGDTLGPYNHAQIAAGILGPFVSEENLWMVRHHDVFQGYFFFHHLGGDRDLRDRYAGHPCFDRTAEFCELYDAPAFDPSYRSEPLEHFEPMVRAVLANPVRLGVSDE